MNNTAIASPDDDGDAVSEEESEQVPTVFTNGPDGKMIERPATPAEIEHAEKLEAKNEAREVQKVEDANAVLSLLDPVEQQHVEVLQIEFGGKTMEFNFRVLSFSECAALEAKKYRRGKNGQIVRDPEHEEKNMIAWLLHWCVVKDINKGKLDENEKPLKPDWKPLFTLPQVREEIMGNTDPKAMQLLYGLTAHAWSTNPQTSPLIAAQALQQME